MKSANMNNHNKHDLISYMLVGLVTMIFFGSNSYANTVTCHGLFESPVASKMNLMFEKAEDGITGRGYLGYLPKLTPESSDLGRAKGMMYWGLRIYVQPSIEMAKKHASEESDLLMQGVYLIGDLKSEQEISPKEAFDRLVGNGVYYFGDQKVEKIDSDFISQHVNSADLSWLMSEAERGAYLYQHGWFFPKIRGVIKYEDTAESKTYKKLRKQARSLIESGFKITFNRDFGQALDKVANQARRGQEAGSSRFTDEEIYNEMLANYASGQAFSVEVWDSAGRLVGGVIGNRSGNLYSPDSVFYDTENYSNGINFAKLGIVALMDRMNDAGIPFVDAGMVTPFTAALKGQYIPGRQFLELIRALPAEERAIDFSDWTGK